MSTTLEGYCNEYGIRFEEKGILKAHLHLQAIKTNTNLYRKLIEAVKTQQHDQARFLLEVGGVNPNAVKEMRQDGKGERIRRTPLMRAIKAKDLQMVHLLLKNNADPNQKSYYRSTDYCEKPMESLLDKVKKKYPKTRKSNTLTLIAKELVKHGANLNETTNDGQKYCDIALKKCPSLGPHFIKSKVVGVNYQSEDGKTFLYQATRVNDLESVQELLSFPGVDLNVQNDNGRTPLHKAVIHSSPEIIKKLLEKGANVHLRDKQELTPLHYLPFRSKEKIGGEAEVINILQDAGADMNALCQGQTPLEVYLSTDGFAKPSAEGFEAFVNAGARLNFKDPDILRAHFEEKDGVDYIALPDSGGKTIYFHSQTGKRTVFD